MSLNVQRFEPTEEQEVELLKLAGFKVNSKNIFRVTFYKEPRGNRQIQKRERQEKVGRNVSDGSQVIMVQQSYEELSEAEKTAYEDNPIFDVIPIPYIIGKNGKIKGNWTNGLQPYEVEYLSAKYELPVIEAPKNEFDQMPVIKIDPLKVWDYRNYADQAEVRILLECPKVVVEKEEFSREKPILLYLLQEERANKVGEIEKHANKLAAIIDANQKLSIQEKAMIVEILRYNGIILTGSNNEKDLAAHFLSVIENKDQANELYALLKLYGKDNAEASKSLLWNRLWYNRSKINLDVFFDEDTSLWKGRITDRESETLGAEENEAFNAYVEKHRKGFTVWVQRAKEMYKEERKDDHHQLLSMDSYNVKSKLDFFNALSNEEIEKVAPVLIDPISGVTNEKVVVDDFDPSKATETELKDWVHSKCNEDQINAYGKLKSMPQKVEFIHKIKNTGK